MQRKLISAFSLVICSTMLGAAPATENTSRPAQNTPPVAPSMQQNDVDIDGIAAALNLIPTGVLPAKPSNWTVAKHDVANDVFTHLVLHKNIRLQLKVLKISRREGTAGGYDVNCVGTGRDVTPYNLNCSMIFPPEQAIDAARLNVGDEMFVKAAVASNLFHVQAAADSFQCQLELTLVHAAIESNTAANAPAEVPVKSIKD